MTKKIQRWHSLTKLPLAVAVAATVSTPAGAFQFYMGDMEANLDTTLSAGVSWRVAEQNKRFIGPGNLAPQGNNPYVDANGLTQVGASTTNYDDGNLNFENGDVYSKTVKGTTEFLTSYENLGFFTRLKYWYDFKLKDEKLAVDGAGQRRQLNQDADGNASGAEFLDAYVWADWDLGEMPLNVRLGKQVVSWGESTFIFNGINVINPVDVGAVHTPGAEVKDVLLPVQMLYGSLGISENVTLEAFLQLKWEQTRPDDCGTFFSTVDFVSEGCGPVLTGGNLPESQVLNSGLILDRNADRDPDDTDQFGLALRWYAPALNETEFGLYFIQYHSRLPLISGVVADVPNGDSLPEYFVEYPENIQLSGLSFNTSTESGYSVSGEYSFKHNVPVQWNSWELIYGGLGLPASFLFQDRVVASNGVLATQADAQAQGGFFGKALPGYDLIDTSQLQFTLLKFYDQVLGASRITLINEVGGTYIHGFGGKDKVRYGRSGALGYGPASAAMEAAGLYCNNQTTPSSSLNLNPNNCTNEGFVTAFSWGYRTRLQFEYNDVMAGVNLVPTLSWTHDVNGVSPGPGGNFIEGRKSVGLKVKAVYLNDYSATIGYTNFFGGEPFNDIADRDNVSLSVSYSF